MYKLELTLNNNNETLLKEIFLEKWNDVKEEIDNMQKWKIKNSSINLYKFTTDYDSAEYLGNFSNIKRIKQPKQKKKINYTRSIIFLEVLCFPIMILFELMKKK